MIKEDLNKLRMEMTELAFTLPEPGKNALLDLVTFLTAVIRELEETIILESQSKEKH